MFMADVPERQRKSQFSIEPWNDDVVKIPRGFLATTTQIYKQPSAKQKDLKLATNPVFFIRNEEQLGIRGKSKKRQTDEKLSRGSLIVDKSAGKSIWRNQMKNSLSKGKPQEKIDAISNKFQESKMNFAVQVYQHRKQLSHPKNQLQFNTKNIKKRALTQHLPAANNSCVNSFTIYPANKVRNDHSMEIKELFLRKLKKQGMNEQDLHQMEQDTKTGKDQQRSHEKKIMREGSAGRLSLELQLQRKLFLMQQSEHFRPRRQALKF